MLPNRMVLNRQTEDQLKKAKRIYWDYTQRRGSTGIFPLGRE